ncbi:MAG: hypothetical protein A2Y38_14510 [Spirochaetes bacterium GWB1_59_5]|nr:MAG: hypothetical protein A2Y38_14510 [Spirochaetes bacterium GWB1_59_5]
MSSMSPSLFFRLFGAGEAPGVDGQMYAGSLDRRVLLALARTFQPRVVVEFGVQRGITAALLLRECPQIESYVGVDVPPGYDVTLPGQRPEVPAAGQAGELAKSDPRFRLLLKAEGTAGLVAGDLPVADLVYIDADHSAEGVRRDTILARAICRPGGIIAWHDYGNSSVGVTQVIDALNRAEGDPICHVEESWVCFEFKGWRGSAPDPAGKRGDAPRTPAHSSVCTAGVPALQTTALARESAAISARDMSDTDCHAAADSRAK